MGSVLAFEMLDRDRCFSIALKTYSEAVADSFITKEGFPLKCDTCFSTKFERVTVDTITASCVKLKLYVRTVKFHLPITLTEVRKASFSHTKRRGAYGTLTRR